MILLEDKIRYVWSSGECNNHLVDTKVVILIGEHFMTGLLKEILEVHACWVMRMEGNVQEASIINWSGSGIWRFCQGNGDDLSALVAAFRKRQAILDVLEWPHTCSH
jgi:hypothetical protein